MKPLIKGSASRDDGLRNNVERTGRKVDHRGSSHADLRCDIAKSVSNKRGELGIGNAGFSFKATMRGVDQTRLPERCAGTAIRVRIEGIERVMLRGYKDDIVPG